ncbi:MAG: hypothetical protein CO119_04785 [Flavobacteriales bacterium CG_4_9_14_3_um_filter_40_17]|nr:MAG: hypothetical protein CO119_04785 [Flavobacteriales bacterium CG_4_9_14_3_um_filter_40_17]
MIHAQRRGYGQRAIGFCTKIKFFLVVCEDEKDELKIVIDDRSDFLVQYYKNKKFQERINIISLLNI